MATYNVLPQPMTGQGAFGKVPGTIDLPLSRYAQVGNLYGNLPQATQQYLANAQTQMAGGIPKSDQDYMQQLNAEKAVAGGMPGAGAGTLYGNRSARDLGLLQYNIQNQGMQNYLTGLNTLGNLQLSPELQTGVASENAALLATPDPAEAFQKQLDLYNQGLRIGASSAPWSTTRGSVTPTPQGGTGAYQTPNTEGGNRNQQSQVTVGNYVPNYSNWNALNPSYGTQATSGAVGSAPYNNPSLGFAEVPLNFPGSMNDFYGGSLWDTGTYGSLGSPNQSVPMALNPNVAASNPSASNSLVNYSTPNWYSNYLNSVNPQMSYVGQVPQPTASIYPYDMTTQLPTSSLPSIQMPSNESNYNPYFDPFYGISSEYDLSDYLW